MSPPLTSKQRAYLRGLGHKLNPLTHVGKEGVTEALVDSIRQAFSKRELIKIRTRESAPEGPRESAEAITAAIEDACVVQAVGYTALIYRPHPDSPEIKLPV